MTENIFKFIHLTGSNQINEPYRINVNYDTVSGTTGRISGITVTTEPLPESDREDITSVLRQVESIVFTVNSQQFDLDITSRSFYSNAANEFFYFSVDPLLFEIGAASATDIRVGFSPFLNDIQFGTSDYNPLISNVQASKRSADKYQVDRQLAQPQPSNFQAILGGTATLAQVQDSTYSDTGWSNARFDGSKTSAKTFGGISPAITGRGFLGEVFTLDSTDVEACSIDASFRILIDLFHNGPNQLPEFTTSNSGITSALANSTVASLTYTGVPNQPIKVNDIFILESEYVRVLDSDASLKTIDIERGYLNTTATSHTSAELGRIDTNRIFRFESNNSGVTLEDNSKIWVNDSNTVLTTDKYGTVYTASAC